MNRFFDPDLFARAYRDPMAWLTLLVDLLPVIAVVFFGWKAVPLVALYWLENLVIGAFTVLRMLGTIAANLLNIPNHITCGQSSLVFEFSHLMLHCCLPTCCLDCQL